MVSMKIKKEINRRFSIHYPLYLPLTSNNGRHHDAKLCQKYVYDIKVPPLIYFISAGMLKQFCLAVYATTVRPAVTMCVNSCVTCPCQSHYVLISSHPSRCVEIGCKSNSY